MTRGAVVNDTGMIEHRRCKAAGQVTDTAILGGQNVTDILLGHRPRCIITMTFYAVIDSAGMIKDSVGETLGVMAHPAILVRGRMISCLSYGPDTDIIGVAIMARGTIGRDTQVVENRRSERKWSGGVTQITILARGQMVCGLNYIRIRTRISGQELADMASFAATANAAMVYRRT